MAKQPIAEKALYEQEEQQIQEKSDAFIRILTQRGILGNDQIKDERIRQAQQEKQRRMYHNTRLLLEQYRNIAWALECFPDTIAAELDHPLGDLDSLLGKMDLEMGLGNRKLESRLESVKKSRLLLDRVNEALTVLKRKPDNGPKMYELIYQTYLAPEKLSMLTCCTGLTSPHVTITGFVSRPSPFCQFVCGPLLPTRLIPGLKFSHCLKAFDENVMAKKKAQNWQGGRR